MKDKKLVTWLFSVLFFATVLSFVAVIAAQTAHAEEINLNRATAEELEELSGITSFIAKGIVEHREKLGFFKKIEDVLKVPGMSKELLNMFDPQIDQEGNIILISEEEEDWSHPHRVY